jgi:hypothetical protein
MNKNIEIKCPTPKCNQTYRLNANELNLCRTISQSCNGCGQEIWISDDSVGLDSKSFTIYSDKGTKREHSATYEKRSNSDGWRKK